MSSSNRVFEAYYKKALRTDYKSGGFGKTSKWKKSPRIVESSEALVQGYNEIWQPAVEFVENKLAELPSGGSAERLYLEALLGALQNNKITAEENVDHNALRQKIDGLVSKLSSLQMDAPSGDLQDYIKTFVGGMNAFHNRISVMDTDAETEAPPEEDQQPPTEEEPSSEEVPEEDQNSQEDLLRNLGIGGDGEEPAPPSPDQPEEELHHK